MKPLAKQMTQYQQQVFSSMMETPLLVLASVVMQRYLCLIIAVHVIPVSSIYYAPPTLTRLLYRMVFREKYALFRAGRVDIII